MRLYLIHRKYYIAYLIAQQNVERILNEHEVLLQKVQPKSSLAEHEREFLPTVVSGGGVPVKKAEEYAIEMERRKIRERLEDAKVILDERKVLLDQKEEELRKSKDVYNMVYCAKWVDGKKSDTIVQETGYSRSQIYNIIGHLKTQIERSI